MHVVWDTVLQTCVFVQGKVHIAKMHMFSKFRAPSLLHCVFYHLRHGLHKNNEPRDSFPRFLRLLGPLWGWGRSKFLVRDASQTSMVLPRIVCLCGAVRVCGECHGVKWRVEWRVFALCLGTVRCEISGSLWFCATRRNRVSRPRKPLACGPKHCRFSRTSHGCLPTFCKTRESKVPPWCEKAWKHLWFEGNVACGDGYVIKSVMCVSVRSKWPPWIQKFSKTQEANWKDLWHQPCHARGRTSSIQVSRKWCSTMAKKRSSKHMYGCTVESHESTRQAIYTDNTLESGKCCEYPSLPLKIHEDRIAGKGSDFYDHIIIWCTSLFRCHKRWRFRMQKLGSGQGTEKVKDDSRGKRRLFWKDTETNKESPLCYIDGHMSPQKCGVITRITEVQRQSRAPGRRL